jgi:3-deoxy-D-manno-octulosonate 8-phosphate phosphatase (KDO 8-P phosphatase)
VIELLVLDVDGCLTDGKIIYSEDTAETKAFNVKDGLAIRSWIRMGKKVVIITGRESKVVVRRSNELRVDYLFQGVNDKLSLLKKLVSDLGLNMDQVAAIGDDLNDYKMLKSVGKSFTPNNGSHYLQTFVNVVLKNNGGEAAVREMIEMIIKENGEEDKFLALWV